MPVNSFMIPGPRLGVKALAVALFTDLDRGRDMDQDEAAVRFDHRAYLPYAYAS